jgi:hypothetical protein
MTRQRQTVLQSSCRQWHGCLAILAVLQTAGLAGDDPAPTSALGAGVSPRSETASANAPQTIADSANALQQKIQLLTASDFARRQVAFQHLQNLAAEELRQLGDELDRHPSNQVVRLLIEVIERHYMQADRRSPVVVNASEILEQAALSPRWFVAEAAGDVLTRQARRRVELAVDELVAMNANLEPRDPQRLWLSTQSPGDFSPRARSVMDDRILKIYIDDSWPPGPRSLEVMQRLQPLLSSQFLRDQNRLAIFLTKGHPLSQEEIASLRGVFGDTQFQERGRVSLGVTQERFTAGEIKGVLVGDVKPGSSADRAGIAAGDLIVAIDGEVLADFDSLVRILEKFNVGDTASLQVIRGLGPEGSVEPVEVKVQLQKWGATDPVAGAEQVVPEPPLEPAAPL